MPIGDNLLGMKILTLALALGAAPALFVIGCKKKEPSNPATSTTTVPDDDGQASQDNRDVQSENDNAVNDINKEIGDQAKLTGRSAASRTSPPASRTPSS